MNSKKIHKRNPSQEWMIIQSINDIQRNRISIPQEGKKTSSSPFDVSEQAISASKNIKKNI